MRAKKYAAAAAAAAGGLLLGGCGRLGLTADSWEPQGSAAISIEKNGTVTEILQDTLDETYYSIQELEDQIYAEIASYNAKQGIASSLSQSSGKYVLSSGSLIKVKKFQTETGAEETGAEETGVYLELSYASVEDYAEFNNLELYYGSIIGAQLSGYLFDVSYQEVTDGTVTRQGVSGTEVIREMDKQVLILQGPVEVKVPGEVLYISENAEILDDDVVNASGSDADEGVQELVLPSSAVYRSGEEASFEEKQAARRVYIIFDDFQAND